MKSQGKIGLALIVIGGGLWLFMPGHVTWGNHHYFRHMLSGGLVVIGAVLLIAGARD